MPTTSPSPLPPPGPRVPAPDIYVPDVVDPGVRAPRGPWSRLDRIVFRYLCCHWLLYAFPRPFSDFFAMLRGVWELCLPEGHGLPSWAIANFKLVEDWSGRPGEWWNGLTSWLYEKDLTFGVEVIHHDPRTGSGDTGAAYVQLACTVLIALVLTAIWNGLDRRRTGHPVLGRWVHLGARWYVALIVLVYGVAKFYGGQFAEPSIAALTQEVGDHSPMGLVWTFMGASQPYNYLAGAGEIACFALLLHHRTVLLGSFLTLAVMGNVVAINWLYGWPVKLYSAHLWLIALFLLAPYRGRLWALFISNQPSQPVDMRVTRSAWFGRLLLLFGAFWAIGATVDTFARYGSRWEKNLATSFRKPELYGLWNVEKMLLDGKPVPPSDSSRWESLAIDRGGDARAKTLLGQAFPFTCIEDLGNGAIKMKPAGGDEATWKVERSTVTRKVRHPAPKTPQERDTPIDGPVDAAVFRGTWQGKELELHTVKKQFRLHDPFRFIREFPR